MSTIFSNSKIQIVDINNKASELGAVRFDKGSSSPKLFDTLDYSKLSRDLSGKMSTYPDRKGSQDLIECIQKIESEINDRDIEPSQICITNGALSGLFFVLGKLADRGDSVIINELSFEGFISSLQILGLNIVKADYSDLENLEKTIVKSKSKILILNTPENPSGKIYSSEFLETLGRFAEIYDLKIISDEVNNQNIYNEYKYFPPSNYITNDRLISVNSFSKNYYIAGVRLGWIVAEEELISELKDAFTVFQVGTSWLSQVIVPYIVSEFSKEIRNYRSELAKRRNLMQMMLEELNLEYLGPVMAGSVFFVNMGVNSEQLTKELLEEHKIGVIPGVYFGDKWKNYIRLGFGAVSEKEISSKLPIIKDLSKKH